MGKSWISSSSSSLTASSPSSPSTSWFCWSCMSKVGVRGAWPDKGKLLSTKMFAFNQPYSHAQPIISFLSDPRPIIAWPCNQLTPVVETWWIWLSLKTSCCCCCCWCWYLEKNCQRVDDSCQLGNSLTKTLHSSTMVWNFLLNVWSYFWRSFVGWNIVFPQEFVDEITSKYCQPCFGKAKRIMVAHQSRGSSYIKR